jgi:hypothetical protein
MHGAKRPVPDGRDHKLVLHVGGNNVPLDAELKAALATAKVDGLWATLSPKGKVTFAADVDVIERAPPLPIQQVAGQALDVVDDDDELAVPLVRVEVREESLHPLPVDHPAGHPLIPEGGRHFVPMGLGVPPAPHLLPVEAVTLLDLAVG